MHSVYYILQGASANSSIKFALCTLHKKIFFSVCKCVYIFPGSSMNFLLMGITITWK